MVYIRTYICTYIYKHVRTLRGPTSARGHIWDILLVTQCWQVGCQVLYKAYYAWAAWCHHIEDMFDIFTIIHNGEIWLMAQLTHLRIPYRVVCLLLLRIWLEECTYVHTCVHNYIQIQSFHAKNIHTWKHFKHTHTRAMFVLLVHICTYVLMCLKLCESVKELQSWKFSFAYVWRRHC